MIEAPYAQKRYSPILGALFVIGLLVISGIVVLGFIELMINLVVNHLERIEILYRDIN